MPGSQRLSESHMFRQLSARSLYPIICVKLGPRREFQMRRAPTSTILAFTVGTLFMVAAVMVSAQDKPTGLRDARAAIEENMSTAAGKTYDEQFGTEFGQKHLGPL